MKAPSRLKKPAEKARHDPLHVQLRADIDPASAAPKSKQREKFVKRQVQRDHKAGRESVIDAKLSKKILRQAQSQLEEEQMSDGVDVNDLVDNQQLSRADSDSESDNQEIDEFDNDGSDVEDFDDIDADFAQYDGLSREDENILAQFMPDRAPERRNLADIIMQKFQEASQLQENAEAGNQSKPDDSARPVPPNMNPKVVEVYTKVGQLLSKYKSGKLPKAFKIIPSLKNWEDVIYLTKPEDWTPHSMYQATRIFSSNLKPKQAQRFFNLILLDAVRADIAESGKANVHLYNALKKALYKPAAWFKGILLPMCLEGCTLHESIIFGSVLAKSAIPVLHAAAVLLKIAEMEYTGANSIFIRILLDKKYALPYRVIDALVKHFVRFRNDSRKMPVLWHQALLVFCQRYKIDLNTEQKSQIMDLIKHQSHYQMTPEIRRELTHVSPDSISKEPIAMEL